MADASRSCLIATGHRHLTQTSEEIEYLSECKSWMDLKLEQDYITLNTLWDLQRITLARDMQDTFISQKNLASYSCSSGARAMDTHDFQRSFRNDHQDVYSVVIRMMRPTVTNSPKSKGLVVRKALFLWRIFKELFSWLYKNVWWKSARFVCVHHIFHSTDRLFEVDVS